MDFIFDPSLVLYLPLEQLDGSPFTSKDARGHLCTASGAALEPGRGRYFDGTDDQINTNWEPYNPSGETIIFWGRRERTALGSRRVVAREDYSPNRGWRMDETGLWYIRFSGGNYTPSAPLWGENDFHMESLTFAGTSVVVYEDGKRFGAATMASNYLEPGASRPLRLGRSSWGNATHSANVTIGLYLHYFRTLSLPEIQNIYLATKWRWQ